MEQLKILYHKNRDNNLPFQGEMTELKGPIIHSLYQTLHSIFTAALYIPFDKVSGFQSSHMLAKAVTPLTNLHASNINQPKTAALDSNVFIYVRRSSGLGN
jgi:hypothetical protein